MVVTLVVTLVPFGVTSVVVTIVGLSVRLSIPLDAVDGIGLGADVVADAVKAPLHRFVVVVVVSTVISGSTTILAGSGSGELHWYEEGSSVIVDSEKSDLAASAARLLFRLEEVVDGSSAADLLREDFRELRIGDERGVGGSI